MHKRAVWKYDFESEHMRRGESVLEAMRAAGIFGNIAADAAHRLRRRIGRVEIFLRQNAAGDIEIYYAWFDDDARIRNIDFENAIHSRQADHDSIFDGKRAAAEACARTARNERDFFGVAEFQKRLDLSRVFRKQNAKRHHAKIRESVAFVGAQFFGGCDQSAWADDFAESSCEVRIHSVHEKSETTERRCKESSASGKNKTKRARVDVRASWGAAVLRPYMVCEGERFGGCRKSRASVHDHVFEWHEVGLQEDEDANQRSERDAV